MPDSFFYYLLGLVTVAAITAGFAFLIGWLLSLFGTALHLPKMGSGRWIIGALAALWIAFLFTGPVIMGSIRASAFPSVNSWLLPPGVSWQGLRPNNIPVANMTEVWSSGAQTAPVVVVRPSAPPENPEAPSWCPVSAFDAQDKLGGTASQWVDGGVNEGYRKWVFYSGAKGQEWTLRRPDGHGNFDTGDGVGLRQDVSADRATFNCID